MAQRQRRLCSFADLSLMLDAFDFASIEPTEILRFDSGQVLRQSWAEQRLHDRSGSG